MDGYRPFISHPHSPHLIQSLSSPYFPTQKTQPHLPHIYTILSLHIHKEMAAISAAIVSATSLSGSSLSSSMRKQTTNVVFIQGLNSFNGLKASSSNNIATLGLPKCADRSFSVIMNSLKSGGRKGRGGALSSTCNAAAEIFKIAAIMNGLVLVGVAVGFVLLRIEATLEEE